MTWWPYRSAGPDTELEFWRSRMTKFTSITKQLQRRECKIVMGVTSAGRSKAYKRWKDIDVRVTGGQQFIC